MKIKSKVSGAGYCQCGNRLDGKRKGAKTCSAKCRKALSRKNKQALKNAGGGIRINGEWHPADTLKMWFDGVLEQYK